VCDGKDNKLQRDDDEGSRAKQHVRERLLLEPILRGDGCAWSPRNFWMGPISTARNAPRTRRNHRPWVGSTLHQVNVPEFKIDTFEVTVTAYKACVNASACTAPGTANRAIGRCRKGLAPGELHHLSQASGILQVERKATLQRVRMEKAARGSTEGSTLGKSGDVVQFAVTMNGGCWTGSTSPWAPSRRSESYGCST